MEQISLKKNFMMNIILTMSSIIFPLITFPYVSRILGPTGTGKVTFATSLISYFSMFAQLGIPTYGIRACARVRDNKDELTKVAQELLIINLIMSIFSYIALFIALFAVPKLQDDRILYVIVSFTIILTSIGMEWIYKALEQYTYITVRSVIFKFIALIAMFLLIHQSSDYIIYGAISILAASSSNIFNFINVHKYISLKPVGNYNFKRHLKPIFVFFSMACAVTVYTNLDTIMLGFMKDDTEVGYYNAAIKIQSVLVSVVGSLGAVLLPRTSYYVEHNMMNEFNKITKKAISFVILISFPLTVFFILYAREGILLLSGIEYLPSVIPMQIIIPTVIFIGITNVLGIQILVPLGKENIVLYSEIVGAIVDIIINTLTIPKFGATGAAFGTLVAEFTVLLVQYRALKEHIYDTFKQIHYSNIIVALIIGTLLSIWIKVLNLKNFISLFVSAVLFFVGYFLYLLIKKDGLVLDIWNVVLNKINIKKNRN